MEKILSISPKLNFTTNILDCYGLNHGVEQLDIFKVKPDFTFTSLTWPWENLGFLKVFSIVLF